jgi:hypothetical protein
MEMPSSQQWFLRKHGDGSIFGPLSFEQLAAWASSAQIAPHDALSTSQEMWMKAPMLPELCMDWLVEVTTERYYGPTTLGAIQEFLRVGDISSETFIINSCDGTRKQISEMPGLLLKTEPIEEAKPSPSFEHVSSLEPAATRMSIGLQDRIRDLEQSLREERRALAEAEQRCAELERKCQALMQERASEIPAS